MAKAKVKTRLPSASLSGPDPKFPLDDEAYRDFERHLGRELDHQARHELADICNVYLLNRASDRSWQTYDDVLTLTSKLESTAKALWDFANRGAFPNDAEAELDEIFSTVLSRQPVSIHPERGELLHLLGEGEKEWVPFEQRYEVPEGSYAVAVDLRFLERLAMSFRVAVNLTVLEIQRLNSDAQDHDRIGSTERFFLQLHAWAKKHEVPRSEYIGGRDPAPFAYFVAAIMKRVPEEWWESRKDTNAGAVAMQIKRAKEALNDQKEKRGK